MGRKRVKKVGKMKIPGLPDCRVALGVGEDAELGVRGVLHVHVPHVSLADLKKTTFLQYRS